jgi:alpha-amylase
LSSVLDFPLYLTLPAVLKGLRPPADLIARYEALREHAISRGELGRYLVTFVDNHDQIGQDYKRRFAAGAPDRQVIAAVGYLLFALGTPCLYYGTEQGLSGEGPGDEFIREALFDLEDPTRSVLNRGCRIYQEIGKLAAVNRSYPSTRFGRMYFREISGDGVRFGLPTGHPCTLAFSRILADEEVLVAYNTSTTEPREDAVVVDGALSGTPGALRYVYGGTGAVPVLPHPDRTNGIRFVRLRLDPMQLVVLANHPGTPAAPGA